MQLTPMSAGKGEKQEVKLTGAQKEQKLQNKTGKDLKQKAWHVCFYPPQKNK